MKTICICSSAAFYEHVGNIQTELESLSYKAVIPSNAQVMKDSGDYEVSHYKTWFENADDYTKKADYIRRHFDEIEASDAVLIVNDAKHGVDNYIGGNVLMEMAVAFHFKKPIFLLNDFPVGSTFEEEIKGLGSQPLRGNLAELLILFPNP